MKFTDLKAPGSLISRGDLLAGIDHEGKILKVYSPISGRIAETNGSVSAAPGVVNEDPYENGWIYKIYPSRWIEETETCYMADKAVAWTGSELQRFKDFLAGSVKRYSRMYRWFFFRTAENYATGHSPACLMRSGTISRNHSWIQPAEI